MKKILLTILILGIAWMGFGLYLTNQTSFSVGTLSVLTVQQGGTGASTLTGCLTGNGTSPITGTGSACGSGGGGGGTSAFEIATTSDIGLSQYAYFAKVSGRTTLASVSTSTIANFILPFTSYGASTSTTLGFTGGLFSTASSTFSSNLFLSSIGQGFLYTGTNGIVKAVASSSITLSSLNNDLATLTATNASLTFTGAYNGSVARTVGINLGNTNTWTVLQNFNYSSSTIYSSFQIASTTSLNLGEAQGVAYVGSNQAVKTVATSSLAGGGPITVSNSPVIIGGSTATLGCTTATASVPGCISAADFSKALSATTTFSTGLTYTGATNAVTVNTSQNIATLSNLTNNGFVRTSGSNGTLGVSADPCTIAMGCTNQTVFLYANTPLTFDGTRLVSTTTKPYYLDALVASSTITNSYFMDLVGHGTTTPQWQVDIASTTRGQIALEGASTDPAWVLRSIGGSFYMATASPTTFATSSAASTALTINQNGTLSVNNLTLATSSAGCASFMSTGVLTSIGSACGSGGGGLSSYDAFTHLLFGGINSASFSATTSQMAISTSTAANNIAALTVASSTASQIGLSDGTAGDAQWTFRNAGGTLYFSTTTAQGLATTSTAALTLTGSGKPGIAVSSSTPNATLTISNNSTDFNNAFFIGSTTELFRVTNTGSVYANRTSGSGSAQTGYWCYDADGQLVRDTVVCIVSARKFKKDIEPLNVGLSDLMKMNFVSYLKKDPLDVEDSHKQMGIVADDVAKISPELNEMLVTYVGGGTSGEVHAFRYEQFTALLGQSIKDLNQKVEELPQYVASAKQKATDDWQWIVIGILVVWNISLTFRKRK